MTDLLDLAPGFGTAEPTKHRGHPLFPRPESETGPDPRNIDLIHIERWLPDGTREVCPIAFKASEIRSWEDITKRFGGECTYQLRAQCGTTFRWQGTTEKTPIASPPIKPFVVEAGPPKPAPAAAATGSMPAAASAPPAPAAAPVAVSPPSAVAPVFHHVPMGSYLPQPAAPAPGGMSDLVAVLQAIVKSTADMQGAILRAMIEARAPHQAPSTLELLRELKPMLDSSGGNANALLQGVELAKGLFQSVQQQGPAAAPAPDDFGSALGALVKMVSHPTPQAGALPPTAPAAAAPPGGWMPPPGWAGWGPAPGWGPGPWGMPPHAYGWPVTPGVPPVDADALLLAALRNPAVRERLSALIGTLGTAAPAPPGPVNSGAAPPAPPASPSAVPTNPTASPTPAPAVGGEPFNPEGVFADPDFQRVMSELVPPHIVGEILGATGTKAA
jgi:hypothetical protein